jgi:hypothetical protein
MRALLVLVVIVGTGCATLDEPSPATPQVTDGLAAGWSPFPTGAIGGEPSIGVTSSGTIFMAGQVVFTPEQAVAEGSLAGRLLRSTDGGVTWEPVGDAVKDPKQNNDPWMWVDGDTDRVFNAPLNVACSSVAWSDDDGEHWDANPAVACVPPSHDHQKLVTGPPTEGVTMQGYPNVVYYAYNSLLVTGTTGLLGLPVPADERLGTFVATSLDGGLTFGAGKNIHGSDCHRGIVGPPAIAPDGRIYVPHGTCEGVDVMISSDSGETWKTASIDSVGSLDDFAFDPGVAVDTAGTAYLVWPGADALLYLAKSHDGGGSWSAPRPITPEGVTVTVYSSITAGAPGKVAIAYAATTRDPTAWKARASSYADEETVWHLEVTTVDGDTVSTERLTTDDDPLQRGCIWMRGGESDCRNLLDFVTLVHHEGTLYLAYTDGCVACESAATSKESRLMLAVSPGAPLARS